jgi:hypothetical protein
MPTTTVKISAQLHTGLATMATTENTTADRLAAILIANGLARRSTDLAHRREQARLRKRLREQLRASC